MPVDRTAEVLAHHVCLLLDNEEGTYHAVLELVESARESEYPRSELSGSLRDLVETLCGFDEYDDIPMMSRELLGVALSSIDWHAMAVRYLEDES